MPQFKKDKLDKMFEQTGTFNPETLKFHPKEGTEEGYMVQFDSVTEFEKYRTDKNTN